jgi:rod shape-determining protein MreD
MRRALLAAVAILAAVLLQVTLLNNVPFPGGAGPDLVLVVVVALALTSGARDGAIIGFAAGLALDIAPPASNLLGQSALVFCLVGYGCGRLRVVLERSAWLPLAGVAVGAAAGEALYALVGLIFGDPDVTWQAVRQVLPAAVFYDLLISPFVLYAVAWLGGHARWGSDTAPAGLLTGRELAAAGGGVLAGVAAAGGAVRDTGVGRSPRLRAAGHRTDGWIGAGREQSGQPAGAWLDQRRPPRLRLRGGVAGSATASQAAKPARPSAPVHLRLGTSRRRDGTVVARRHLAGAGPGAAFDGRASNWASRPARLRGGALSGGPSALGQGQPRKQRQPRLKLGSKRGRDGPGRGGRFSALRWPGRPGRRRRMGKGSFASGSAVRAGTAGAGRSAAAPRFRSSARARKPAGALRTSAPRFRSSARARKPGAAPRTSAPRFRQPKARWQRAGRRLGFGGSRGAGPGLRTRSWRRRFSRAGQGGWR